MNATLMLSDKSNNYHSYLVRLWRDKSDAPWRASAQCVQTGKTYHFANVDSLLAFLHTASTDEPVAGKVDGTRLIANQI